MTMGFYTIIKIPYEGCLIREHKTKREATQQFAKDRVEIELNKSGVVTEDSALLGAALVRIDIVEQKGDWKE